MSTNLGQINASIGLDIKPLENGVAKAETKLASFAKGSNSAAFALQNLGRVAQDAPFGFIGIQNNINPLLESFQRLKAETGSTGSAIKALVGSLTGAAGLGFAVSIVTSLLTVFAQQGLFKATVATDALAKAQDDATESAAKELIAFRELTAIAADETQSRDLRTAAIKKLRAEYGPYLKNLSDEQILSGKLGDAYEKINQALLQKVLLQAAEEKVLPLIKQQLELQLAQEKAQKDIGLAAKISQADLDAASKLGIDGLKTLKAAAAGSKVEFENNSKALNELERQINNLFGSLGKFASASAGLDLKVPGETVSTLKTVDSVLADLKQKLDQIKSESILSGHMLDTDRVSAMRSAITALLNIPGVTATSDSVATLTKQMIALQAQIDLAQQKTDLLTARGGATAPAAPKSPVNILRPLTTGDVTSASIQKNKQKLIDEATAAANDIQKAFDSLITNVVGSFGESLGAALAGKQDPFAALKQTLASGIKSLGESLIKLGAISLPIQKALKELLLTPAGPFIVIGAGVALEALAGAITSKGVTPHAEGGVFTGPTQIGSHLFGEAGPEFLVGQSKLQQLLQETGNRNGNVDVTGRIELSYNTLAIAIERSNRYRGRNYGGGNG